MPNLEATVDELIKLFPREMDGLYVVPAISNPAELKFFYVQRGTEDPRRDWNLYDQLEQENRVYKQRQEGGLKLPKRDLHDNLDSIYRESMPCIEKGLISPNDRVLLKVHLTRDTGKDDVVYLVHIQRNRGPDLRGLGEEFYKGMLPWLKNKGYNFLKALPNAPRLNSYWQQLGQVPIVSLDVEQRKYLTTPMMASNMHVHILS